MKRAAPKKVKQVATPEPSEEEETPLEDTLSETTEDEDARSPIGDEVNQPLPEASTTIPCQPQAAQTPQPQTVPTQASVPQFQPRPPHPRNTQGIFVHRQAIFEDEESVSTHPLPNLPLLNPDPVAAYQTYEPTPTTIQAITQTPTQAPIQASTPSSPTQTLDSNIPSHTTIQPPPSTPADKALRWYRDDWEQAALKFKRRYPHVPMNEALVSKAADFLTYVAYRGTEYYKIFNLCQALSEETIMEKEAAQLQFIGVDGFKALIKKAKYWELLDAVVKRAYPDAELPERKLSEYEAKLIKKHEEELSQKNQEIIDLKGAIRRRDEEIHQQSEDESD